MASSGIHGVGVPSIHLLVRSFKIVFVLDLDKLVAGLSVLACAESLLVH